MVTTKQRRQSSSSSIIIPEEITNCWYCKTWLNYGSEEDNALMDKKSPTTPDWNAKECHRLLKLLYLGEISIKQFKKMLKKAGMDYNQVEHCCGCAGCYYKSRSGSASESESGRHTCPDFNMEGKHDCKLRDPVYCDICADPNKPLRSVSARIVNKEDYYEDLDAPSTILLFVCDEHELMFQRMDEDEVDGKEVSSSDQRIIKHAIKNMKAIGLIDDDILQEHIGK